MSVRDDIVAVAREQIGCPYDTRPSFPWDGPASDYGSFNCSGLARAVYEECGLIIPGFQNAAKGNSQSQWVMDNGNWCWDVDELRRGDLVFWSHSGEWDSTYHVGIYTGNGMCVSANGEAMGVAEHSVWYDSGFVGGGWPLDFEPDEKREEPKVTPKQPTSKPKNDLGLKYRAHSQGAGWLPAVHDGQTAGTEGFGARMEAMKITPPDGMVLDAYCHVQGIGNLYFDGVRRGKSSGTGSSSTDPIIGTVGQARRMEAIMLRVTKWPTALKDKRLMYQGHVQDAGWTKPCTEGQWCGTRGEGRRIEAVRIWIE